MTFQVIPAIDLRGGQCVRLLQGDYARETVYSADPVAIARRWESLGAPMLHVVDLDGARAAQPVNNAVIVGICDAVGIPVEVSGGLRTLAHVADALERGAALVQLGSAAVTDPGFVREACGRFPGRIGVSIDSSAGGVVTDGWQQASGREALELAREMLDLGVTRLMFTDVSRDGMLTEPNFDVMALYVRELPVPVIASGGVSQVVHLRRLAEIGCAGAVVGKALYEGTVRLPDALAAVG